MQTLFLSHDFWYLVENGYDELNSLEALSNRELEKLRKMRRLYTKALMFIQSGISDLIFPRIAKQPKLSKHDIFFK